MALKMKEFIHTGNDIVLSVVHFRQLVQYERVRSDRFGSSFSILEISPGQSNDDLSSSWINHLKTSKRVVDHLGWKQNGIISILLPDTDHQGACRFLNKLQKTKIVDSLPSFEMKTDIFTYPDHWIDNYCSDSEVADPPSRENGAEDMFVDRMPVWKRGMDVLFTSLLLTLTAPVFLIVGLYLKIVSPGPIFFTQLRIGFKGVPFTFWKFRTMKYGNDQAFHGKHSQDFISDGDTPMIKLDGEDPRIIPGGKILRASCLDELPQLWNVMKGDMSLVGPRPCIMYEAQEYLRWHTHRFDSVPGMTGLWQVSGKNNLTFRQMIRLDIKYSQNLSFWKDIYILLKTPVVVLKLLMDSFLNRNSTDDCTEDVPDGL